MRSASGGRQPMPMADRIENENATVGIAKCERPGKATQTLKQAGVGEVRWTGMQI